MNRFIFFWLSFRKLQHHTAASPLIYCKSLYRDIVACCCSKISTDDERLCDGNNPDGTKLCLNYEKVVRKPIGLLQPPQDNFGTILSRM